MCGQILENRLKSHLNNSQKEHTVATLSCIYRTTVGEAKTIEVVLTMNNLLADLLIHQTFFCQMLKKSQFTELPPPNFPAI